MSRLRDDVSPATLAEAIICQAGRTPDRVAVVAGDRSLTYTQLAHDSTTVAMAIGHRSPRSGAPVAVVIGRQLPAISGIVGSMIAGRPFMPIDPTDPPHRIERVVKNAEAELALVTTQTSARVPEDLRLNIDDLTPGSSAVPLRLRAHPDSGDIAYIIHTSGSTGQPKAVAVPHRALTGFAAAQHELVRSLDLLGPPAVALNASLAFDASLQGLVLLARGATLHLLPDRIRLDGPRLRSYLRNHRIDLIDFTPSHLREMLSDLSGVGHGTRKLRILLGGESIDPDLWDRLRADPTLQVVNVYGVTEAACNNLQAPVSESRTPSNGRPLTHCHVRVLGERLEQVPDDVVGELCIGGDGLALGYLSEPGLTAERFIADPYSDRAGARLFRTGDRARRVGSRIEVLGRTDNQIKYLGHRIEVEEIEAVLRRHHLVTDALVRVEDRRGAQLLVGYVSAPHPLDRKELRDFLLDEVPHYMVPAELTRAAHLPRTRQGKIDRAAAIEPAAAEPGRQAFGSRPSPATLDRLGRLWRQVLPDLSPDDTALDFFQLGGDSFLGTDLVTRIADEFAVPLDYADLVQAPTLDELAGLVESRSPGLPTTADTAVAAGRRLPLSATQQEMLHHEAIAGVDGLYNLAVLTEFSVPVRVEALRIGLDSLTRRYPALSSSVGDVGGRPHLVPRHQEAFPFGTLPAASSGAEPLIRDLARTPFDLARGPLCRAYGFTAEGVVTRLLLVFHHALCDGLSVDVLLESLRTALTTPPERTGRREGNEPAPAPAVGTGPAGRVAADVAAHSDRLYRAPQLSTPAPVMRRRKRQNFAGGMYSFAVPGRVSEAVDAYRLTRGLTAFQVMLAGFYVAMSVWTSNDDLVIGAPYANRKSTEEMQAVGCYVNMVPLRLSLSGSDTFEEICRRTVTVVAFGHRHVTAPLSEITRALQLPRSGSHSPLFQVTFSVQREIGHPSHDVGATGGATVFRSVRVVDNHLSKYDLITTFYVSEGHMRGEVTYQTDLFDRADVTAMSHEYLELLPALLADPKKPIQELL
ncbi:AMP-binding protein [Amycolatopsis vastitatis]|uniref:Carrier domain-containing protein n=1 Tax=Amycolatopsis vastitatis TaxID=1905142 RepID=A0A229SKU9_9PSEU|nr:AMP-binding protein [Amycolatopsis vastitatis]OXM59354.1 hypothetical protein CF165_48145 [Amycolatopsis vastitatis]